MKKIFIKNLVLFMLACLFPLTDSAAVYAVITWGDIHDIVGNKAYYKADGCEGGSVTAQTTSGGGNLKSGDKVYILGDSITDGAEAKYTELFSAKGITAAMSGVAGRSWTQPGNIAAGSVGTTGTGKEAAIADAVKIKEAKAVIIALGTNNFIQENPIDEIITTIKSDPINSTAPIYWVSTARTDGADAGITDFNAKLVTAAPGKFTIIDWAKTVDPSGKGIVDPGGLLRDKVHPTLEGYQKLGELVVNATTSGAGAAAPAAAPAAIPPADPAASGGPGEATTFDLEYTDDTRAGRKVGATIWDPGDSQPHPLIMFAPGQNQNSKADGFYKRYLKAIASQGFIVAGANYDAGNNDAAADVPGQADDIKFLIGKIQADEKTKSKIQAEAGVGMVGHSDGGFASMIVGYADGKKDERIKAVIAQSGANFDGFAYASGPPFLGMGGTGDAGNTASVTTAFNSIQTPYSALAVFKSADHDQWLVAENSAFKQAADNLTVAFLKRKLSNDNTDVTKLVTVAKTYETQVDFKEKGTDSPGGSTSGSAAASGDASCCAVGGGASAVVTPGSNAEEKLWNFLTGDAGMKFTATQAAGIMANVQRESTFNPTALNPLSGAYGLVQWYAGRRTALEAFAVSQGKDKSDVDVQLAFLKTELDGPYKNAVTDPIRATNDVEGSTRIWLEDMEVPCLKANNGCAEEMAKRLPDATTYLTKYGSGATSSSTSTSTTQCSSSAAGGNGEVVGGFSLPIDKKFFQDHPDWLSRPHHGEPNDPNIDIGVPEGTPIYSAIAGVVSARTGGCGKGIQITAANGMSVGYCHGTDGAAVEGAKVGDTVTAGQLVMHSSWTGHVIPASPQGTHLHMEFYVDGTARCTHKLLKGIFEGSPPAPESLPSTACQS